MKRGFRKLGMFVKVFSSVLVVHLLGFAYFATGSKRVEPALVAIKGDEAWSEEAPLVPLEPAREVESKLPERKTLEFFDAKAAEAVALPGHLRLTELKSGIVVDLTQGRTLWSRDSARAVPIASMTKMMTALLALEAVRDREEVRLGEVVRVTEAAYRIGGSQVWLDPRESFSLEALLVSLFVHSANDSSYLIGEHLAGGDMGRFVGRMNERARELGMVGTSFANAHGLPEKVGGNVASCEDLARLAAALLEFDEARRWASLEQYVFRADVDQPTVLTNHNRLLRSAGVDGLKTGYTREAGYCTTVSCLRDGRRIVVVVTGFTSSKRRDDCAQDLLEWAYAQN